MTLNKFFFSVATAVTIFAYMNCSPLRGSLDQSGSLQSSSGFAIGQDGVLFSLSNNDQIAANQPLVFFADPAFFEDSVSQVFWSHGFNGTDMCTQQAGETEWSVIVTCAEAGALDVFLNVEYDNGMQDSFSASLLVLAEPIVPDPPLPDPVVPDPVVPAPTPTPTPQPPALDGAGLYLTYCMGCHGPGSNSNVRGRSAAQIRNAINRNRGGMGSLSNLSDAELNAIATYISQ